MQVQVMEPRPSRAHRLETDPRLHRLNQRRIVADSLGGLVRRLCEVFAVQGEQKLDQ